MRNKIATIIADVHAARDAGRLDLAIARAIVGLHAIACELDDLAAVPLVLDTTPPKPIAYGLETSSPKGKGK